jgi:hypothetical protein
MATRCRQGVLRLVAVVALVSALFSSAQGQSASPLSKAQLEQLVAPIALHPDPLLSQMLMASTYPIEVVQAARWAQANPKLTGQALQDAMQNQPWDASVKALTAVPQTLEMMSDKLDWTQQLGDAFLSQQEELLAAVQRLRQRAAAAGHLKSSEQQTVRTVEAPAGSGTTAKIAIAPASAEDIYVPIYDPGVVYGAWPHADYAPFYWYPAGYAGGGVLSFATAVAAGAALWGNLDWGRDRVDVNVNRYNQFNRTKITDKTWRHDVRHRGNVPYRDPKVGQRFGDPGRAAAAREAYRGKAEAGRRDLAKGDLAKTTAPHGGRAASAKADKQSKVGQAGSAANTKAAGAKQAAKARSSAGKSTAQARNRAGAGPAAKSRQAGRPQGGAHRPQPRGYAPTRSARPPAFRSGGGGHRLSMGGGGRGGFRGGGGRRGRR